MFRGGGGVKKLKKSAQTKKKEKYFNGTKERGKGGGESRI